MGRNGLFWCLLKHLIILFFPVCIGVSSIPNYHSPNSGTRETTTPINADRFKLDKKFQENVEEKNQKLVKKSEFSGERSVPFISDVVEIDGAKKAGRNVDGEDEAIRFVSSPVNKSEISGEIFRKRGMGFAIVAAFISFRKQEAAISADQQFNVNVIGVVVTSYKLPFNKLPIPFQQKEPVKLSSNTSIYEDNQKSGENETSKLQIKVPKDAAATIAGKYRRGHKLRVKRDDSTEQPKSKKPKKHKHKRNRTRNGNETDAKAHAKSRTGKSKAKAISKLGDASAVALNGSEATASSMTMAKHSRSSSVSDTYGIGGANSASVAKGHESNATSTAIARGLGGANAAAVATENGNAKADSTNLGIGKSNSRSKSIGIGDSSSNSYSRKGNSSAASHATGGGNAKSSSRSDGDDADDGSSSSVAESTDGNAEASSLAAGEGDSYAHAEGKETAVANSASNKGSSLSESFSDYGDAISRSEHGWADDEPLPTDVDEESNESNEEKT